MQRAMVALFVAAGCTGGGSESSTLSEAAKTKVDTPVLTCSASTETTIVENVCAPADGSGLPAGFSLQWETLDDFNAHGWDGSQCAASFSGVPGGSRYNVAAGTCVAVTVGDFLADVGFSVDDGCGGPLTCGTTYVFRAFGHNVPGTDLGRSDFSDNGQCTTASCACVAKGQGFWKNHYPDAWPVTSLTLGTVSYTAAQLEAILETAGGAGSGCPKGGNGLIDLGHQLIAAKLNVAAGATGVSAIADADAFIGSLSLNQPADCVAPGDIPAGLIDALDAFNSSCGDSEGD